MRRLLLVSLLSLLATSAFAGTGRVVIVNTDPAGVGFNDPTPVEPVGGNSGTTLGKQRLNVFEAAAERWSAILDTNVNVIVQASFSPIPGCTETDAILGQAGPLRWVRDFANAPKANTWYPVALANKLSGSDLDTGNDIIVRFNADVDNNVCLGESNWYYGFDGNNGTHSDLFVVTLHEIAHGLGISGAATAPNFSQGRPAVFDTLTLDLSAGRTWNQMNDNERRLSLTNTGNVVWNGEHVKQMVGRWLQPVTTLNISEPQVLARDYDLGFAGGFGARPNLSAFSGSIVRVTDVADTDGPTTFDGCTAYTNVDAIPGKVAMVDRGTCTFVVKARNAQAAGATALIVVDNNKDTCIPPAMGGEATDITIPVISISQTDGDIIKTQLAANANVNASLRNDPTQLAGTKNGYLRLYAPCTNDPGSSTHHWDVTATPNLLMEPSVNSDLLHGVDLTVYQLLDMGWSLPPRTGRPAGKR
ncbi:MAG TPA: PA domain-containing protein [Thermoanaerobaculia bacterium]|nr:PA domain-containing protein [Thermoanaerobaculia bacterium]